MNHIAERAEHIYLALGATDFRKQQNGLTSLVSLKFKLDPYSVQAFPCSAINVITRLEHCDGMEMALSLSQNSFRGDEISVAKESR